MKIKRNKYCPSCPKNKREDEVWRKGLEDGIEMARHAYKPLFWRFYWAVYK